MNELTNPGFEDGHHHQDGIAEIVVPDGWVLYYLDNAVFPGIGTPPAYRPESVVWNIAGAPPHEQTLFFLDGIYCWKVFKAWAPVYFAVTQHLQGLTPGQRYRFTAQIFPDIVERYEGGQKVYALDEWAAEARAGWSAPGTQWPASADGDVNWSDWFNRPSSNFAFGQYNDVWVEFVAPASGEVRVWAECKAKWGFENNWFMDAFSLIAVEGDGNGNGGDGGEQARGAPRVPYDRTYVLLPASLSLSMVAAAVRAAYGSKSTVGFSADDAGIGDLDNRRIVCVNPSDIGTGLTQAWYDEHYPGVTFDIVEATNPDELEAALTDVL